MSARNVIAATLFVLATLGCGASPDVVAGTTEQATGRQHMTAGFVGCPAHEITISDSGAADFAHSWIASCRGRQFVCTLVIGANVSCEPMLEHTGPTPMDTLIPQ